MVLGRGGAHYKVSAGSFITRPCPGSKPCYQHGLQITHPHKARLSPPLCAAVLVEGPVDIYNRYQMDSLLLYHSLCFSTGSPQGPSETGKAARYGKGDLLGPVP
jgi:hypothetical protein